MWLQYEKTDKLADIVNEYNNKYNSTTKMKLVVVDSSTNINPGVKIMKKT